MLADETDFIDLYGKLRLEPDCSLAEFKQAYRRHVSAWHPDRRSRGERADALAARRLQRLMAQYSAAMDFHKRHGRLPGAPPPKTENPCGSALARDIFRPDVTGPGATGSEASPREAAPTGWAPTTTGWTPTSGARRCAPSTERRLLWVAVIVMGGVAAWALVPEADRMEEGTEGVATIVAEPVAPAADAATLALGMKDDEVAAVEGQPTLRTPDRWEYGPSWVRFEGGSVVDWYSSPLRTLHVRSAHPPH
jgi:hypothetical protein